MTPSSEKIFEPSVLRWARERAGIPIDHLAVKLAKFWKEITPDVVAGWENGGLQPRPVQVKKLAEIYKRPTAVFLLAYPPEESVLPPDRRTLGLKSKQFSEEALLVVRKARRVQRLAAEFEEELESPHKFKYSKFKITENAASLAARIREDLLISIADQTRAKTYADFFAFLRQKIEAAGVITLRSGGHNSFPIEDARAFSFVDQQPYVILINNHDTEGAKNFSLLHEFAHILLREAGICNNFSSFNGENSKIDMLEVFCNKFAANFLVPEEYFLGHRVLSRRTGKIAPEELDLIVKPLAKDFKVSRFVVLRKLLTTGLIASPTYKSKSEEWENEKPLVRRGGLSLPPRAAILNNGVSFSSLVLEAYKLKKLSYAGVSDCLGMKTKHIPAFEKLLLGHGK